MHEVAFSPILFFPSYLKTGGLTHSSANTYNLAEKGNRDMPLSIQLRGQIENFLSDKYLGCLYKEYHWYQDTWGNGFPEMQKLEVDLTTHTKQGYVTETDIIGVAKWGHLPNIRGIQCPERIKISLYDSDDLAESFRIDSSTHLRQLRETIKGMGPTYLSKVLMFSRPQRYGAIDTRLVRVFGCGDKDIEGLRWLSLEVRKSGYRWHIPEYQTSWPGEYGTWIEILHYIAHLCNASGHKCPHPDEYIARGLREKGIWIVADVETALFSYASKAIEGRTLTG